MGKEKMGRHEVEQYVDGYTNASSGMEQLAKALTMPEVLAPLAQMNATIKELEEFLECECDKATCIASAPHAKIANETILKSLDAIKAARDELREQTIEFVERLYNCECEPCKLSDMAQSAPFN